MHIGNISATSYAMTTSTLNQTEIQNPSQDDLEKLNSILAERLTFDPFSVDDETLWRIVSERENAKLHNYHCMIVRFGEPYEVPATSPYSPYKRVTIYYANKQGSKKWGDFGFSITTANNRKRFSILLDPYNAIHNKTTLLFSEISNLLPNKQFLLSYSVNGINKFGQKKSAWVLVKLFSSLKENACVLREYILLTQIWAYKSILASPEQYGLNLSKSQLENVLIPLIENNRKLREEKESCFLPKHDLIEEEMNRQEYLRRGLEDNNSYLDDELDYIRQNGGDWIDD